LLKTALCNTGDTVSVRALMTASDWSKAARSARWFPMDWVAQRRFEPVPLATPLGPVFPCIGVYTIDGHAAGIYARLSGGPIVDFSAVDVAVLLEEDDHVLHREDVFELWAPSASVWAAWAKPVLFAHLELGLELEAFALVGPARFAMPPWAPPADGTTAIVLELPGPRTVAVAMALAQAGFRPVPLFNAVPAPHEIVLTDGHVPPTLALVDVQGIADAIAVATMHHAQTLAELRLDAPPVFLLDSARRGAGVPRQRDFDNRSLSLPTDFPSAAFLQSHGVSSALLITENGCEPAIDLAHTLLRWQVAGLALSCSAEHESDTRALLVRRPSWFRAVWHNALSVVGLERHPLAGFGAAPEKLMLPSAG
jgi:hypothetical protein